MTVSKPFSATLQKEVSMEPSKLLDSPRLLHTEEGIQLSWGDGESLPLFEVLCKPSRSEALNPWVNTLADAYTRRRNEG